MSQPAKRVFSTEFKQATVLRLEAGERIGAVSGELKIKRKLLYEWSGLQEDGRGGAQSEARAKGGVFGRLRQPGRRAGPGCAVRTGAGAGQDRRA